MAGFGDKPYGLREVKVVRGTTVVTLPAAQKLGFAENIRSEELQGDDKLAALVGFSEAVEWELEAGGISLEALAVMTGRAATQIGSGNNRRLRMNASGGQAFPYFTIYGRSMGDAGDDIHVKLFKCKLSEISGEFAGGGFFVTSCTGTAIDDGTGIYQFAQNETAAAIATGVPSIVGRSPYSIWASAPGTWAINAEGYAYNTPNLGAELVINGGFDTDTIWTKGAGWTISGGKATAVASSESLTQSIESVSGGLRLQFEILTITGGSLSPIPGGAGGLALSTAKTHVMTDNRSNGASSVGVQGANFSGTVDNILLKAISYAEMFALLHWDTPLTSVSAKIRLAPDGHESGLIICADNTSSPSNYVAVERSARDSHRLRLVKYVNGVWNNLIQIDLPFVGDGILEIRRPSLTTFQLWYNGTQAGTDVIIADEAIIYNPICGVTALAPEVQFKDFTVNGELVPFDF